MNCCKRWRKLKSIGNEGRQKACGCRFAQLVGCDWRFFSRQRRFDQWQALKEPPLEDWLELLDAVQRLIARGRLQREDEDRVRRRIRELFPEAVL